VAPAHVDLANLHITTQGFENGSNSGGTLAGISMNRAGGSLTHVTVNGVSHGNGVQEGNAIAIRNRVSAANIDVPRAKVNLSDIEVSNYQKTGLLLDGNLAFTVDNATIGQGKGPQGQPNPAIAANSVQISRGASGSVRNSTIALNSHDEATGALLYNAENVAFDGVTVTGDAPASTGIDVYNDSNTIDTTFTMRGGQVTRTAAPAAGTGLMVDGSADAVTASVSGTSIQGWAADTTGNVTVVPVVQRADVNGSYHATRPHPRKLRLNFHAAKIGADQVEGKLLHWRIIVDGQRAAVIRQHAGDSDVWAQRFPKGSGTHTVEILKNGVSQRIYKIHTR
jgi:hypothetical protein